MFVKRVDVGSGKNRHPRYFIREGIDDVAYFDDLCTAGIVCRFIKGAQVNKADYDIAKAAMQSWDKRQAVTDPEEAVSDDTI
jgi:hypothetical protein